MAGNPSDMRFLSLLGACVVLCTGTSAQAQATGAWRVDGAIAGRNFKLDCRFDGASGVCVDAESGGKRSHPLTSLTASGDQVAWSFKTKVALMSITLNFAGRVDANRMTGTMRAAGRTGSFTGVRR